MSSEIPGRLSTAMAASQRRSLLCPATDAGCAAAALSKDEPAGCRWRGAELLPVSWARTGGGPLDTTTEAAEQPQRQPLAPAGQQ